MKDAAIAKLRSSLTAYRRNRPSRSTPIPPSLRAEIVDLLKGHSAPELARELGISSVLLYKWRREMTLPAKKPSEPDPQMA